MYNASNQGHINNTILLQWATMAWANGAVSNYDTELQINHSLHSRVNEHYMLCTYR